MFGCTCGKNCGNARLSWVRVYCKGTIFSEQSVGKDCTHVCGPYHSAGAESRSAPPGSPSRVVGAVQATRPTVLLSITRGGRRLESPAPSINRLVLPPIAVFVAGASSCGGAGRSVRITGRRRGGTGHRQITGAEGRESCAVCARTQNGHPGSSRRHKRGRRVVNQKEQIRVWVLLGPGGKRRKQTNKSGTRVTSHPHCRSTLSHSCQTLARAHFLLFDSIGNNTTGDIHKYQSGLINTNLAR